MLDYLIRLWHVILFILIWIGLPWVLAIYTGEQVTWMLIFLTWFPAGFIVDYLSDDKP
tara:strand:- start:6091 stop:6264 length:174 start_codon:yes stop_codon:yes gene_type:complete